MAESEAQKQENMRELEEVLRRQARVLARVRYLESVVQQKERRAREDGKRPDH